MFKGNIKIPERRDLIVNFGHISHLVLVFLFLLDFKQVFFQLGFWRFQGYTNETLAGNGSNMFTLLTYNSVHKL